MKRVKKPVFFIVALLIIALTYTSLFGVYGQNGDFKETYIKGAGDIRWGIDIRGGVEATFSPAEDVQATDTQLEAAKAIIETRMVSQNITDYELYTDAPTTGSSSGSPGAATRPTSTRRRPSTSSPPLPSSPSGRAWSTRPPTMPRTAARCTRPLPAPRRRTSSWRALTS